MVERKLGFTETTTKSEEELKKMKRDILCDEMNLIYIVKSLWKSLWSFWIHGESRLVEELFSRFRVKFKYLKFFLSGFWHVTLSHMTIPLELSYTVHGYVGGGLPIKPFAMTMYKVLLVELNWLNRGSSVFLLTWPNICESPISVAVVLIWHLAKLRNQIKDILRLFQILRWLTHSLTSFF